MAVRRLLACLVVAALTVLTLPAAPAGAEVGCVGAWPGDPSGGLYPEQRQAVESQTWWTQDGGSPEHFHLGLCLPERETLNAAATPDFTAWVRVIMHDNPGTANYVSMVFKGTDYETTVQKCYLRADPAYDNVCAPAASTGRGDWTCVGTCVKWVPFSKPLSLFGHTGLQEIRFRAFIPEPKLADGVTREMRANLNAQTYVTGTGRSVANVTREPYVRTKGWYSDPYRYTEATFMPPVPDAPVSGVWSPQVRMATHTSDDSAPVTHHFATLDPDFHADPPVRGTVLLDADGPLDWTALAIDTTTLANGTHRLYLRADSHGSDLGGGTNSGVGVIPFVVANPEPMAVTGS